MYFLDYVLHHMFAILSYMKQLSLVKPHAIVMVGIPGSGKTFFAEKFSETFRAPFINKDKLRAYAPDQADELTDYLLSELLKTGQSIIIEGGTDTRTARSELSRKVRAADYEILLVWVQTDLGTAKARASKESDLSGEAYDKAVKHFTAPAAPEKSIVISGKHTYASQAKVVLQRLSAPRAEISAHSSAPLRPERPSKRSITIR